MIKKIFSVLLCACILTTFLSVPNVFADNTPPDVPEGFLAAKDGKLWLDGKPFYEISFNDYQLFYKFMNEQAPEYYKLADSKAAEEQLKALSEHGFKIVRIFAPSYGAATIKPMLTDEANRRKLFKGMDKMLDAAKKYDMKLVFCFAQRPMSFDDVYSLPMGTIFRDYESDSYKLYEEYILEVVSRYKDRPEIAMWELTNEGNLNADLIRLKRAAFPYFYLYTSREMGEFYSRIATKIREIDPYHLITTGDSTPRNAQWHLLNEWETGNYSPNKGGDWTKDTPEQKLEWLNMVNKDMDVISIHWYLNDKPASFKEWVEWSEILGKPLMIGEYQPAKLSQLVFDLDSLQQHLDEMIEARVPLMLFWNFGEENTYMKVGDDDFNMIVEANKRLKELTGSY